MADTGARNIWDLLNEKPTDAVTISQNHGVGDVIVKKEVKSEREDPSGPSVSDDAIKVQTDGGDIPKQKGKFKSRAAKGVRKQLGKSDRSESSDVLKSQQKSCEKTLFSGLAKLKTKLKTSCPVEVKEEPQDELQTTSDDQAKKDTGISQRRSNIFEMVPCLLDQELSPVKDAEKPGVDQMLKSLYKAKEIPLLSFKRLPFSSQGSACNKNIKGLTVKTEPESDPICVKKEVVDQSFDKEAYTKNAVKSDGTVGKLIPRNQTIASDKIDANQKKTQNRLINKKRPEQKVVRVRKSPRARKPKIHFEERQGIENITGSDQKSESIGDIPRDQFIIDINEKNNISSGKNAESSNQNREAVDINPDTTNKAMSKINVYDKKNTLQLDIKEEKEDLGYGDDKGHKLSSSYSKTSQNNESSDSELGTPSKNRIKSGRGSFVRKPRHAASTNFKTSGLDRSKSNKRSSSLRRRRQKSLENLGGSELNESISNGSSSSETRLYLGIFESTENSHDGAVTAEKSELLMTPELGSRLRNLTILNNEHEEVITEVSGLNENSQDDENSEGKLENKLREFDQHGETCENQVTKEKSNEKGESFSGFTDAKTLAKEEFIKEKSAAIKNDNRNAIRKSEIECDIEHQKVNVNRRSRRRKHKEIENQSVYQPEKEMSIDIEQLPEKDMSINTEQLTDPECNYETGHKDLKGNRQVNKSHQNGTFEAVGICSSESLDPDKESVATCELPLDSNNQSHLKDKTSVKSESTSQLKDPKEFEKQVNHDKCTQHKLNDMPLDLSFRKGNEKDDGNSDECFNIFKRNSDFKVSPVRPILQDRTKRQSSDRDGLFNVFATERLNRLSTESSRQVSEDSPIERTADRAVSSHTSGLMASVSLPKQSIKTDSISQTIVPNDSIIQNLETVSKSNTSQGNPAHFTSKHNISETQNVSDNSGSSLRTLTFSNCDTPNCFSNRTISLGTSCSDRRGDQKKRIMAEVKPNNAAVLTLPSDESLPTNSTPECSKIEDKQVLQPQKTLSIVNTKYETVTNLNNNIDVCLASSSIQPILLGDYSSPDSVKISRPFIYENKKSEEKQDKDKNKPSQSGKEIEIEFVSDDSNSDTHAVESNQAEQKEEQIFRKSTSLPLRTDLPVVSNLSEDSLSKVHAEPVSAVVDSDKSLQSIVIWSQKESLQANIEQSSKVQANLKLMSKVPGNVGQVSRRQNEGDLTILSVKEPKCINKPIENVAETLKETESSKKIEKPIKILSKGDVEVLSVKESESTEESSKVIAEESKDEPVTKTVVIIDDDEDELDVTFVETSHKSAERPESDSPICVGYSHTNKAKRDKNMPKNIRRSSRPMKPTAKVLEQMNFQDLDGFEDFLASDVSDKSMPTLKSPRKVKTFDCRTLTEDDVTVSSKAQAVKVDTEKSSNTKLHNESSFASQKFDTIETKALVTKEYQADATVDATNKQRKEKSIKTINNLSLKLANSGTINPWEQEKVIMIDCDAETDQKPLSVVKKITEPSAFQPLSDFSKSVLDQKKKFYSLHKAPLKLRKKLKQLQIWKKRNTGLSSLFPTGSNREEKVRYNHPADTDIRVKELRLGQSWKDHLFDHKTNLLKIPPRLVYIPKTDRDDLNFDVPTEFVIKKEVEVLSEKSVVKAVSKTAQFDILGKKSMDSKVKLERQKSGETLEKRETLALKKQKQKRYSPKPANIRSSLQNKLIPAVVSQNTVKTSDSSIGSSIPTTVIDISSGAIFNKSDRKPFSSALQQMLIESGTEKAKATHTIHVGASSFKTSTNELIVPDSPLNHPVEITPRKSSTAKVIISSSQAKSPTETNPYEKPLAQAKLLMANRQSLLVSPPKSSSAAAQTKPKKCSLPQVNNFSTPANKDIRNVIEFGQILRQSESGSQSTSIVPLDVTTLDPVPVIIKPSGKRIIKNIQIIRKPQCNKITQSDILKQKVIRKLTGQAPFVPTLKASSPRKILVKNSVPVGHHNGSGVTIPVLPQGLGIPGLKTYSVEMVEVQQLPTIGDDQVLFMSSLPTSRQNVSLASTPISQLNNLIQPHPNLSAFCDPPRDSVLNEKRHKTLSSINNYSSPTKDDGRNTQIGPILIEDDDGDADTTLSYEDLLASEKYNDLSGEKLEGTLFEDLMDNNTEESLMFEGADDTIQVSIGVNDTSEERDTSNSFIDVVSEVTPKKKRKSSKNIPLLKCTNDSPAKRTRSTKTSPVRSKPKSSQESNSNQTGHRRVTRQSKSPATTPVSQNSSTKETPSPKPHNTIKTEPKEDDAQRRRKSSSEERRKPDGQKRRMLDELKSSDGFIADKIPKASEDLFVDPVRLSREERALQRAIMTFSEMELKRAMKAQRVKDNAQKKANKIKKKAVQHSKKREPVPGTKGFVDFQPEILNKRTRFEWFQPGFSSYSSEKPAKSRPGRKPVASSSANSQDGAVSAYSKGPDLSAPSFAQSRDSVYKYKFGSRKRQFSYSVQRGYSESEYQSLTASPTKKLRLPPEPLRRKCASDKGPWSQVKDCQVRVVLTDEESLPDLEVKQEAAFTPSTTPKPKMTPKKSKKGKARRKSMQKIKSYVQEEPPLSFMDSLMSNIGGGTRPLVYIDRADVPSPCSVTPSEPCVGPPTVDLDCTDPSFSENFDTMSISTTFSVEGSRVKIPPEVKKIGVNRDSGENVLHKASRLGYKDVVLWCCQTGYADPGGQDYAGFAPLHECCAAGQTEIAKILLAYGADINVASKKDGVRPLHDAIESDHIEMVRLVLSVGGDPKLATYSGRTIYNMVRSKEMKEFLHSYRLDLEGSCDAMSPWQFRDFVIEGEESDDEDIGQDVLANLPPDDTELVLDEDLVFECSDQPTIPLYNIRNVDIEDGPVNYALLLDILQTLGMTKLEFTRQLDSRVLTILWEEFAKSLERNQIAVSCKWLPESGRKRRAPVDLIKWDARFQELFGVEEITISSNDEVHSGQTNQNSNNNDTHLHPHINMRFTPPSGSKDRRPSFKRKEPSGLRWHLKYGHLPVDVNTDDSDSSSSDSLDRELSKGPFSSTPSKETKGSAKNLNNYPVVSENANVEPLEKNISFSRLCDKNTSSNNNKSAIRQLSFSESIMERGNNKATSKTSCQIVTGIFEPSYEASNQCMNNTANAVICQQCEIPPTDNNYKIAIKDLNTNKEISESRAQSAERSVTTMCTDIIQEKTVNTDLICKRSLVECNCLKSCTDSGSSDGKQNWDAFNLTDLPSPSNQMDTKNNTHNALIIDQMDYVVTNNQMDNTVTSCKLNSAVRTSSCSPQNSVITPECQKQNHNVKIVQPLNVNLLNSALQTSPHEDMESPLQSLYPMSYAQQCSMLPENQINSASQYQNVGMGYSAIRKEEPFSIKPQISPVHGIHSSDSPYHSPDSSYQSQTSPYLTGSSRYKDIKSAYRNHSGYMDQQNYQSFGTFRQEMSNDINTRHEQGFMLHTDHINSNHSYINSVQMSSPVLNARQYDSLTSPGQQTAVSNQFKSSIYGTKIDAHNSMPMDYLNTATKSTLPAVYSGHNTVMSSPVNNVNRTVSPQTALYSPSLEEKVSSMSYCDNQLQHARGAIHYQPPAGAASVGSFNIDCDQRSFNTDRGQNTNSSNLALQIGEVVSLTQAGSSTLLGAADLMHFHIN